MSELTWKLAKPLANDTAIKKLEKIIERSLPTDYVECVMKNNAGYPSLKKFDTVSSAAHICNNLLSFDEKKEVNIFNIYESLVASTGNKMLLPFAADPFGNYVCFDFLGETVKVVFWLHETDETELICATFAGFAANLYG